MAPPRRMHHLPPRLSCPIQGCHKGFQSRAGFTQHIQACHRDPQYANLQPQIEPYVISSAGFDDRLSQPPPDGLDILDLNAPHLRDSHDVGGWETFSFTIGDVERSSSRLASSCQTSPSLYNRESPQIGFTEYHPHINGRL